MNEWMFLSVEWAETKLLIWKHTNAFANVFMSFIISLFSNLNLRKPILATEWKIKQGYCDFFLTVLFTTEWNSQFWQKKQQFCEKKKIRIRRCKHSCENKKQELWDKKHSCFIFLFVGRNRLACIRSMNLIKTFLLNCGCVII